jgi:hypothetical protein
MVRACGTYVGQEKYIQNFVGENMQERFYFEDRGLHVKLILRQDVT